MKRWKHHPSMCPCGYTSVYGRALVDIWTLSWTTSVEVKMGSWGVNGYGQRLEGYVELLKGEEVKKVIGSNPLSFGKWMRIRMDLQERIDSVTVCYGRGQRGGRLFWLFSPMRENWRTSKQRNSVSTLNDFSDNVLLKVSKGLHKKGPCLTMSLFLIYDVFM